MIGWIKLHRKFLEWEWFHDSNMVRVFIYLLLKANREDTLWKGRAIKRGQLVTSRKKLSKDLGISERKIRTILTRLTTPQKATSKTTSKTTSELTIKTTNKYSIITICNYESYQKREIKNDQQSDQQDVQQNASKTTTIQEDNKKYKKEEEELITLSDLPGSDSKSTNKGKKLSNDTLRKNEECLPFARTLARIVQSQKNIDVSSQKKKAWANEFRKLVFDIEKVGKDRVEVALTWYRKHVGGEYVPVIESGKSFRDKFMKLEAAIERSKKNGQFKRRHGTREESHYDEKKPIEMNIRK